MHLLFCCNFLFLVCRINLPSLSLSLYLNLDDDDDNAVTPFKYNSFFSSAFHIHHRWMGIIGHVSFFTFLFFSLLFLSFHSNLHVLFYTYARIVILFPSLFPPCFKFLKFFFFLLCSYNYNVVCGFVTFNIVFISWYID